MSGIPEGRGRRWGIAVDAYQRGPALSLYTPSGERIDTIADCALNRFRDRYGKGVSKDAIFHDVCAALHDPPHCVGRAGGRSAGRAEAAGGATRAVARNRGGRARPGR